MAMVPSYAPESRALPKLDHPCRTHLRHTYPSSLSGWTSTSGNCPTDHSLTEWCLATISVALLN